jgi:hypothetical protein
MDLTSEQTEGAAKKRHRNPNLPSLSDLVRQALPLTADRLFGPADVLPLPSSAAYRLAAVPA